MQERIELKAGSSAGLHRLQLLISCLIVISLFAASTPWFWKLGCLVALILVHLHSGRYNAHHHASSDLLLYLDGAVRQRQGEAVSTGIIKSAWVSRWICVIHWDPIESGRSRHSLVCASSNRPDDFRRLRVILRLGTGRSQGLLA